MRQETSTVKDHLRKTLKRTYQKMIRNVSKLIKGSYSDCCRDSCLHTIPGNRLLVSNRQRLTSTLRTASLSSGERPTGPNTGSNIALPLGPVRASDPRADTPEEPGRSTRSKDSYHPLWVRLRISERQPNGINGRKRGGRGSTDSMWRRETRIQRAKSDARPELL